MFSETSYIIHVSATRENVSGKNSTSSSEDAVQYSCGDVNQTLTAEVSPFLSGSSSTGMVVPFWKKFRVQDILFCVCCLNCGADCISSSRCSSVAPTLSDPHWSAHHRKYTHRLHRLTSVPFIEVDLPC
jgi:hypothetical protein